MNVDVFEWSEQSQTNRQNVLQRPIQQNSQSLQSTVSSIITQVQSQGDQALITLGRQFDCSTLENLTLTPAQKQSIIGQLSDKVKQAMDVAYEQIKAFHQAQKVDDILVENLPGVRCELRHEAISQVGLYIPGGTAPLPSTVLMLGATAQVAGCPRRVLCTPANEKGQIAAEILYGAQLCGIDEIYLVGGAQAIAALAYGTETIDKVDKIFGPGNGFVTEAKQQVSSDTQGAAIDMPAGPSEVLVIADANANPAFVAADLLSQAEHGKDSQVILVCDDRDMINQCVQQLQSQLMTLSRKEIAQASINNSRFILTQDIPHAIDVSNLYAPEHLIVQTDNPRQWLSHITNAGSIFLGQWSPESAGDYASGTNHVLPTYGYARNYSSLGLADFCRRFTVQELNVQGLSSLAPCIMTLAEAEGLDAHKQAVAIRMNAISNQQETSHE